MSYPYGPPPQQQGWGPAPQQPQQGGWQQPPAPQPPSGWGPPASGGWQQPQPTQPQGWGPPAPQDQQWLQQQQVQEEPSIQGTLASFYKQPSTGGGPALKFNNIGDWHIGIVSRAITNADTEQIKGMKNTPQEGKPQWNKDGTPKLQMKVPLNVRPTPDYQEGIARWYCNHSARDQLNAKIAASGAPIITEQTPDGPVQYYLPEPGAAIVVKLAGKRQIKGLNDANVWEVHYVRPDEARGMAQQYGIEYPTITEQPAEQAPPAAPQPAATQEQQWRASSQPPAAPPGPPPSTADFAPPTPGQPGNPAQWSQQPAAPQGFPQAPGQFPAWGAVDGQQGAPQGPPPQAPPQAPPSAPQQQGPGAPPPVNWATQGQQPPNGGGFIPQATPPADLAPGLTLENQQLLAGLTGRGQQ